MKLRPLAALLPLALALAAAPSLAAECRPDPLADRPLYVRGTMDDWRADDQAALHWACDHWEIVGELHGEQSFKIGDEDWSPDADLGGEGDAQPRTGDAVRLARKGQALKYHFNGMTRLAVTPAATPEGVPLLTITDLPADTPRQAPPTTTLTDPVALSVAFDS
ncbi:MAG TPA: hypothetical protein VIP05_24245, partial [Burkholderiaceae bacterium]